MSGEQKDRCLNAKELAEKLSVPLSQVYAMTRAGKLPFFKVGKYYRYNGDDVFEVLRVERKDTDSTSLV